MRTNPTTWLLLIGVLCAFPAAADLTVGRLRCEYAEDPLGVDVAQPHLSWIAQSGERGQRQTGYEILAATSAALLQEGQADLWDSGMVKSDQTAQAPYAGKPLAATGQVFWRVRAWDNAGKPSPWGPAATWTMGLLADSDWAAARWITAATGAVTPAASAVMRREFEANRAGVLQGIVDDIRQRGNSLTAGDVGYTYLLRALATAGARM
jgi:alpha-L-rhamnosidase